MTLLALLFAAATPLEALACAAEGCGMTCLERAADPTAADASDQTDGDCADDYCLCAVGHCCQAASVPALIEATVALVSATISLPIDTEPVSSAVIQGLERPPRV